MDLKLNSMDVGLSANALMSSATWEKKNIMVSYRFPKGTTASQIQFYISSLSPPRSDVSSLQCSSLPLPLTISARSLQHVARKSNVCGKVQGIGQIC